MINEYRDEVRGMLFLSNKRPPKKKGGMWSRGRQNRRADAAEASRPAFSFSMRDAGVERGGGGDLGGGGSGMSRGDSAGDLRDAAYAAYLDMSPFAYI
jgi:hypothetical protein